MRLVKVDVDVDFIQKLLNEKNPEVTLHARLTNQLPNHIDHDMLYDAVDDFLTDDAWRTTLNSVLAIDEEPEDESVSIALLIGSMNIIIAGFQAPDRFLITV